MVSECAGAVRFERRVAVEQQDQQEQRHAAREQTKNTVFENKGRMTTMDQKYQTKINKIRNNTDSLSQKVERLCTCRKQGQLWDAHSRALMEH